MCTSWFFSSIARFLGPDFQKSICVYKMGNCTHKQTILYAIIHFAYTIICFWGYNTCTWDLVSLLITPSFEKSSPHCRFIVLKRKMGFFKKKSLTVFPHGSSIFFNNLYTYAIIFPRIPTKIPSCMNNKHHYYFIVENKKSRHIIWIAVNISQYPLKLPNKRFHLWATMPFLKINECLWHGRCAQIPTFLFEVQLSTSLFSLLYWQKSLHCFLPLA